MGNEAFLARRVRMGEGVAPAILSVVTTVCSGKLSDPSDRISWAEPSTLPSQQEAEANVTNRLDTFRRATERRLM